ncbi:MAG: galactokinase [Candidatus Omnitrophota bacterium]|nr:galactokinase [Candidatus Omnitrophota bacterium]
MKTAEIAEKFGRYFSDSPRLFSAPGRVNLIGEHTDYNDGFVFPMALEYCVVVAVSRRSDRQVNIRSENMGDSISFSLDDNLKKRNHWSDYTAGVARMLELEGIRLPGADMLVDSSVPLGAGLSSSAAIEISSALAFLSTADQEMKPADLALLGQRAENQFVGMNCGIMDQFISVHGKKDHALFLDCRSLSYRQVPLPSGKVKIVICNTMVKHELGASEYNKRRTECEEGVRILKEYYPEVRALRDVTIEQFREAENALPDVVRKRCRHVISENQRVLDSLDALQGDDLDRFGHLMDGSHDSLKADYEVSCPELDRMVEIARRLPGCLGGRMTGGGFGGCTVNLVVKDVVDDFCSQISGSYEEAAGIRPQIYISTPFPGAHEIVR